VTGSERDAEAAQERALPDFLGIGALKAGTSYLDAMLRSHPDLSLPLHLKEVEYFTRHLGRGADWYAGQFAPDDGRPRGEVSPQYLYDPRCAGRIARANPAARLLVSVRQPVARTFSQYRHWVQETGYRGDFETFLAEHPGAVDRSRYWTLLQRYRVLFPDSQIHIVVFEQMVADPRPVLQRMYTFLGVDPSHTPTSLDRAVNVSGVPRFPRLYVRSKNVSRWLYAHGAGHTVERVKGWAPAGLLRARHGPGASMAAPSGPTPEVAQRLAASYRADVTALSSYTGLDLVALWDL